MGELFFQSFGLRFLPLLYGLNFLSPQLFIECMDPLDELRSHF